MKQISVTHPLFLGNEVNYITDCIASSWISAGKYVEKFEKEFASFCNVLQALTVSSGTAALHLTLVALNIKNGDEVLIPDITYVSTANVVKYVGAKPVFVDVDRDIWAIDPSKIEEKITKNTKAIIVVHLYGHPADMDTINSIAKKHKIAVIEDACEAHGAEYKGAKVGSLAKAGCFSFSGAKTITTGEGGMVVSNDVSFMKKVKSIKSNFIDSKRHFYHTKIGHPYRYTDVQAAIGLAQLEKIQTYTDIKSKNARLYNDLFKNEKDIQLPPQKPWAKNVFWLYSIVLKKPDLRDTLLVHLKEQGILTRPFFVPMHKLPMYHNKASYPVSDFLSENGICLPSGLNLTVNDIEYVSERVRKFLKTYA